MASTATQPIRLGGGYTLALAPHFQGSAPQRPWKCRLDTGVPLGTVRCAWRAASASKSAGLKRDVPDVPARVADSVCTF